MQSVAQILDGVSADLPEFAAPVVTELRTQVSIALEKVEKYNARTWSKAWKAYHEMVRATQAPARCMHGAIHKRAYLSVPCRPAHMPLVQCYSCTSMLL
jgi:hypothetical protein